MNRRQRVVAWSRFLPSVLVVLAGAASASGTTFAPGTRPEYVRRVKETLNAVAEARAQDGHLPAERFTPSVGRRLLVGVDIRETFPQNRTFEIWWSYAQDGLAMEPSDATLFRQNGIQWGQQVEPLEPENGDFDDFQNVIFERLNNLPRPFGFGQDGGQRTWQRVVKDSFNRWEQVSSIDFIFIPGGQASTRPENPNIRDVTIDDADAVSANVNGDGGGDWDLNALGSPAGNAGEGSIRIAMCELDGPTQPDGSNGGILAWTYHPTFPPPQDAIDDNNTPDPDDDEFNFGYLGNILLDKEERWNDPVTPNLLSVVMTREIGFAIGLYPACPVDPDVPVALMQVQDWSQPTGAPQVQEPLPSMTFTELQEDDVRSVHSLFGDPLDTWEEGANTTSYTDARDLFFEPIPGTNTFSYAPHLGLPEELFPDGSIALSIHDTGDIDRWRLGIPESVISGTLTVSIEPRGSAYVNDLFVESTSPGDSVIRGGCAGTPFDADALLARDLVIKIESYDPFTNELVTISDFNPNAAGAGESVDVPVTAGSFFISIEGDAVNDVQLYDITITVETPLLEAGVESDRYFEQMEVTAFRDEGFFGTSATIGVVDGEHVVEQHDVFSGRTISKVNWPGAGASATSAGTHATIVAGVAAGAPIGAFEGIASEATLESATVATQVYGDGTFVVGKPALYYALLGLANPAFAGTLGLPGAASVVVSTFGGGGRGLNGEDTISQAFDVVASQSLSTFVLASGNNGQAEGRSFQNCPILNDTDPNAPGGLYLGSRSVIPPATSFNSIVVGSVAFVDPVTSPAEFTEMPVVTAAFSSRGPIDSSPNILGGADLANARPGIDVLAIGTGLATIPPDFSPDGGVPPDPCEYDGPEPLSLLLLPSLDPGDDPDSPANTGSFQLVQGTSVSAGIVAGLAALLHDAAAEQPEPLSTHPSVIKAIILNGAEKMEGWTNAPDGPGKPQDQRDGFDRNPDLEDDPEAPLIYNIVNDTDNPLDSAQGAGVVNFRRSLENFITGYPEAQPPQAQFDGPTMDPPETDPSVPTMRDPYEPTGPGGPPGSRPAGEEDGEGVGEPGVSEPSRPLTDEELEILTRQNRGPRPETMVVRDMQTVRGRQPDLKRPRGPGPGFTTTGPQTPFQIPSLGEGPGSGPPGGPPGAIDPGRTPREIGPIFVDPMGWDHANIDQRAVRQAAGQSIPDGYIDYIINVPLLAARPDPANPGGTLLPADQLTVTLCWQRLFVLQELNFTNPDDPKIGSVKTLELENLDLQLFPCDPLGNIEIGAAPIRASTSELYNVEHIFTDIPISSLYLIRVRWVDTDYDVMLDQPLAEQQYGVAWRVDFSPRPEALRPTGAPDLVNVLQSFGGEVGNERYSIPGDIDLNGKVDWKDILRVLTNWAD